ncbi:DUF3107 domain-containing protein [Iamia majanohamensis]|uniref:DUF3107 domain-containing protein n=1 Tax=Iamia majanohamensis TaxID=467976 RepID=A0AAF0BWD6_9ACTN|nr:DUF3107 domain-containing protein [Iamia majanohamensis]WCO67705.1 DUF3107 domain-containing protein [Iamia majanohamensis]
MDVRIGVTYTAKELEVELSEDTDVASVKADVEAALSGGGVLWLTDRKGRNVGVPADKVAYVDLGAEAGDRRIGFAG